MKVLNPYLASLAIVAFGALAGCSTTIAKAPDVSENIRKSLDVANLKDVSVNQDREKGVVTLGGKVQVDADKALAESIARSMAGQQVVANQIAVLPPGFEKDAKTVSSDLDQGIDKNLDAALILHQLRDGVTYKVKNGVVTLDGAVNSQAKRTQTETLASTVPNVQQVVNELQVKNQKASSTN